MRSSRTARAASLAALAVIGAMSLACPGPPPEETSTDLFRVAVNGAPGGSLLAVWGDPNGRRALLVGGFVGVAPERLGANPAGRLVEYRNGAFITRCTTDQVLWWIDGRTDEGVTTVYAVGEGGRVLRYDGGTCVNVDTGLTFAEGPVTWWGVLVRGARDVWAVGGSAQPTGPRGVVAHYDGTAWRRVADVPGRATAHGHDVAAHDLRSRWDLRAPATAPVTLDLGPGERVAVVGPSGSGKSTLAAVLLRFLDPCEGQALLGGSSLVDLGPDDVRRLVGLVDDHPHVFATTLAENIRLARPGASDDEVRDALHRARLGAWVEGLPDGIHTWVGDGHGAVSGGERARIGIARSLLAEQPVLVLDEPTAHLDHTTAVALAHEVLTGDRHRSVLWITHGTAGLDLVDRVVALDVRAWRVEGPSGQRASGRGRPQS